MDELMKIVQEGFESEKMKILAKIGEELESNKMRILSKVEEETESAKRSLLTKIKSYFKDGNQTSSRSNMKLEFRNGIARIILTGEEIKGEEGAPIEMALVADDVAGGVVDDVPEASAKVELFLLNASQGDDWTAEEFEASIVTQVEGKLPFLAGNAAVQLKKGVAVAKNIKIRHHASMIKPAEFKLGARVVGSCRVKEAKTEAFYLKNYRAKYYKKHKNPSLSDEVSRLDSIQKGGRIEKRLQGNKIYTVEDFLIQLLINPQRLKSIVTSQPKKWKAIVNNAQAFLSSERVYCFIDPKQKRGVVFNILGHVLGLCSGSHCSQTSTLQSEKEKADSEKLLASAYQNWGKVKSFDDQNSLQQHLAGLSPQIDNAAASESSSTLPFHSANSAMNLFGDQTGAVQDFGLFTIGSVDGSFFEGIDEYIDNTFGDSRQPGGLINEWNGDEGTSEVVVGSRKRWKLLFCVVAFRKRAALDVVTPIPKKHKVG